MIQTAIVVAICIYHSVLRLIGKVLGLLFAGLIVGFIAGTQDIDDMFKFIKLRAKMAERDNKARKERKEKENGHESD